MKRNEGKKIPRNAAIAMKILVFAKPAARRASVVPMASMVPGFDACFSIAVKEPAVDGRANQAIGDALANHFSVPLSQVRIISGHSAKKKIFIIETRSR
jgi:uncharacterized protein